LHLASAYATFGTFVRKPQQSILAGQEDYACGIKTALGTIIMVTGATLVL
jgi:hypothetical protein